MIWNDAAYEVGVGVSEGCHELGERLFVELPDGAEHALLGFICRAKSCLSHASDLIQTYNSVHWGEGRRGESGCDPNVTGGRADSDIQQHKLCEQMVRGAV